MEPQHKNIRLEPRRYVGQRQYFVTICCSGRRPFFANAASAEWLVRMLGEKSAAFRFSVHAYCVMPDHVHALVGARDENCDLLAFVKEFKHATSYEFGNRQRRELWQKKFYDHILREKDNPTAVAGYIFMNPVRKGLCADPRDYPYAGSFMDDWKSRFVTVPEWVPSWKAKAKQPA